MDKSSKQNVKVALVVFILTTPISFFAGKLYDAYEREALEKKNRLNAIKVATNALFDHILLMDRNEKLVPISPQSNYVEKLKFIIDSQKINHFKSLQKISQQMPTLNSESSLDDLENIVGKVKRIESMHHKGFEVSYLKNVYENKNEIGRTEITKAPPQAEIVVPVASIKMNESLDRYYELTATKDNFEQTEVTGVITSEASVLKKAGYPVLEVQDEKGKTKTMVPSPKNFQIETKLKLEE